MTFGDLFCGIGGFRLGLERAGHECKWPCEIDEFCRKVYLKHWPDTDPFYRDIRTVVDAPRVDMLYGGFPCQDLSLAGKRAGIEGERSGLWSEFARLIGEVRPRYALVENVPGLLTGGMERVLGDLAEIGYDAEWHCIPAAAVGAPHLRDRVWILATGIVCQRPNEERDRSGRSQEAVGDSGASLADSESKRLQGREDCGNPGSTLTGLGEGCGAISNQWSVEPDVGRVAHGVPSRVDRLKSLGNAVVPQVVEWIGRRII